VINAKKWILLWFKIVFILLFLIGIFNVIINPYGIFNTIISIPHIKTDNKIRLIKAIKVEQIKPVSIILGTSRAEFGYDPSHYYFKKPSYNFAISASSMYEARKNFEWALKQGRLKQVLLVLDYIMLDSLQQQHTKDFDKYFNSYNIFKYIFSIDTLKDSIKVLRHKQTGYTYLDNGQRGHKFYWKYILQEGGYPKVLIKSERNYYKEYLPEYKYKDTKRSSLPDLSYIIKKSYENNISLDIIFGPSHIRQWEAFDYFLGYEKLLEFKKDVVILINNIAKDYHKHPFRIIDFATYNRFTSEKIPNIFNMQMKYYWESSHYKNELGLLVLDRLEGNISLNFGNELNISNINKHIQNLKKDRKKYIDSKKYRLEVFGK